ncbi:MAG: hypothetical protein J6Y85_04105 [Alphaproteobacteria bacterium]|nr:hypothetical protein [Alphaproteobacteria bacterium]
MDLKLLSKQTLGHFCVDAACAAIVISGTARLGDALAFFILYNFLAFCLQPLAGVILDKRSHTTPKQYILISFLLLLIGFIPELNLWMRVLLVGVGNCLFHVGAGTVILTESGKKLAPLGIFVSSGAVGLMLGTMFAYEWIVHLLLVIVLICLLGANSHLPTKKVLHSVPKIRWQIAGLLCVCVTIRSFMGFIPLTHFIKTPWIIVMITMGVFLGKSLGGIFCDWLGIKKTVIFSTGIVMLLFLFSFNNPYLWSIVQMIVNLSMPITLYLMYRSMPKYPAFSFGLAAACLVIGLLLTLPVKGLGLSPSCLLFLFMLNSSLILLAEKELK